DHPRAQLVEPPEEAAEPRRGERLRKDGVAHAAVDHEVTVDLLLGVVVLGDREDGLRQVQRLAEELVARGAHERVARSQILEEAVLLDGVEAKVAAPLARAETVNPNLPPALGERIEEAGRRELSRVGDDV